MFKDFQDYGFDSDLYCSRIYSGSKDQKIKLNTDKKIIISTWQSLYKLPKNEFEKVSMIVGDEIHEFGAVKSKSVLTNCLNVLYKLGTTATLKNNDLCSLWTIMGMFDVPTKIVSTMDLVKDGFIANFDVKVINLIYNDEKSKIVSKLKYNEEIDFVNLQPEKMNFVIKLIKNIQDKNENVLVLFKTLDYGKMLKDKIEQEFGIVPFYVDGGVKIDIRENIRTEMEKSNSQIAVCSYGTFSRGINIRNLSNLILVNSIKTEIRLLQSIGRALRLHENKDKAIIWDLVDNLQFKSKINYCLKHFYERKTIYEANKFNVKYFDINLK
jgi:superfamily II DNA or RNA helicase